MRTFLLSTVLLCIGCTTIKSRLRCQEPLTSISSVADRLSKAQCRTTIQDLPPVTVDLLQPATGTSSEPQCEDLDRVLRAGADGRTHHICVTAPIIPSSIQIWYPYGFDGADDFLLHGTIALNTRDHQSPPPLLIIIPNFQDSLNADYVRHTMALAYAEGYSVLALQPRGHGHAGPRSLSSNQAGDLTFTFGTLESLDVIQIIGQLTVLEYIRKIGRRLDIVGFGTGARVALMIAEALGRADRSIEELHERGVRLRVLALSPTLSAAPLDRESLAEDYGEYLDLAMLEDLVNTSTRLPFEIDAELSDTQNNNLITMIEHSTTIFSDSNILTDRMQQIRYERNIYSLVGSEGCIQYARNARLARTQDRSYCKNIILLQSARRRTAGDSIAGLSMGHPYVSEILRYWFEGHIWTSN